MIHRQRGITALGLLFLAVLVGMIAYAGIRLTPVYLEYMKIVSVMDGVQEELDGRNSTAPDIRNSIEKRMVVESVNIIKLSDVKIQKQGPVYRVSVTYDHKVPYVANVSFVVDFNKSIEIHR